MDGIGSLTQGSEVGEYLSIAPDPDAIQITDTPDGGAFIDMGGAGERDESEPPDPEFYGNLAAILPKVASQRIVTELMRKIEEDRESRKKRDEIYEEGIRRTGLGKEAPGGAQFEGASRAVHPGMIEACIDYESRMIKELAPPTGPVKPRILGEATPEKTERAKRKTEHMNWQFRTQIKEARDVLEATLMQVPLGGSQFVHQYWDHRLARPRWEFRSIDKMSWPTNAASFASAQRRTYSDKMSAIEYRQRVASGMYEDIGIGASTPSSSLDEPTKSEKASQKVEGVEPSPMNIDGDRPYHETMAILEITEETADLLKVEEAGELYPYLITIDVTSRQMLSMYRDWEDGDPAREPIEHDFEFPFVPWKEGTSVGFPQIIGSLSAAATGALRALLDSAHANNAFGGLILKGAGVSGQTRRAQVGEFTEIDGGLETDDIRKRVMPFEPNQPSTVLFQLLGFVTEQQKEVIRTTLDDSPTQGGAPVPVGTQMSRVEEGLVVFSAIHARGHAAMDRVLNGLHRLNRLYLPETLKVDADGKEILVRRKDYEGPCDIQPVSEPTIYSDMQRFTQLAYIQSRVQLFPQLYKIREVELAGLKLIKWPDPEAILNEIPQPQDVNAVTENLLMAMGKPVEVFPGQDHLAHLGTLLDFLKSPMLGMNPLIAPVYLRAAMQHAAQHIVYHYAETSIGLAERVAGQKAAQMESRDPQIKHALDELLLRAAEYVVPTIEQALQPAVGIVQQAMQLLQQMAPKPPVDPGTAAVQAAAAETARKGQADQAGNQIDQAKLGLQQQANAIQADRVAAIRDGQQLTAQTQLQKTAMDNQAAVETAAARGAGPAFTTGESMGE